MENINEISKSLLEQIEASIPLEEKITRFIALRSLYYKNEDIKNALKYNYEARKLLNKLLGEPTPIRQKKNNLKSYWDTYLFAAPYDFHSYILYMEKDRDAEKRFYMPRMKIFRPIVREFQKLADDELDILGLSLPPGVGKAQPVDSLVLTPDGFQRMGNINVGTTVISASGKRSKVIGVFPQGKKDVYKITFSDGTTAESCKEHIWQVQTSKYDRKNHISTNIQLKDIMNKQNVVEYSVEMVDKRIYQYDKNYYNNIQHLIDHSAEYKNITKIEHIGKKECQCIKITDPSELYITDGFTITHNTTLGIFFITWLMGREPEKPSLATAYGDKLTRSFYDGVLQIIKDPEYNFIDIFPKSHLVATNSKDETIDLQQSKRFKTLTCRSIDSGLTGATRCETLAYADDMVSGSEEALNRERMDILWTKFVNDFLQRPKGKCKILMIGTRWSVHDPLGRMEIENELNKRAKFIRIPALNLLGNSNFEFDYGVGFNTEHYQKLKKLMDDVSFRAIYQQEPIEREGLLYHKDDLQYFFELPKGRPDAIIAVCDSKNMGKDYLSAPVGYIFGDQVYVTDIVFNNGLPDITKPLVSELCIRHKVDRMDIESNNGGEYFAEDVNKLIKENGGKTSIRTFFTGTNKATKIIVESDYVKKHFVFLHESKQNTEYRSFMRNLLGYTVMGKAKHDDAPDSMAMLAQLAKGLTTLKPQILDRRLLPF